jgi:protein-export membrane protein, SecD/SecF family
MRRRSGAIFSLIVIFIALISYISVNGLEIGGYRIHPAGSAVKQGLDLKGGIYVIEEIKDANVNQDTVNRAVQQIKERVDKFGVVDPVVVKEGENKIRIEIPGMYDQQKALEYIGKTGKLSFIGPNNDELLTGTDVKDAYVSFDEYNKPQVSLEMNDTGKAKFAAATEKYLGQNIKIMLDEDQLVDAKVQVKITDGSARITNMQDIDTAKRVASLIKSGALPVTLSTANVRTIGPSLGTDALKRSLIAGIVGIAFTMLFMTFNYRLPGVLACIALVVFILINLFIYIGFNVTMSLAGISGFLLTIGMAVDSNVLIFERIKEELKTGKTLRASIDAGFHRALSSIIDSNVTTIISGIVLAILGTGPIKGFAITLIIGTLSSIFTAVTVTRFLLNLVYKMNLFNNNTILYGVRRDAEHV